MSDSTPSLEPQDDDLGELHLPEPLPVELGQLASTVTWWLESHDVTDPAVAPAAVAGQTLTLEAIDSPEAIAVAAALCGLLTNSDAAILTAWIYSPTGELDHDAWMRQCAAIRDHICELRPLRSDAPALHAALPAELHELVTRLASTEVGCTLVDGPIAAACVLLAYQLNPDCLTKIRPMQQGRTPAETQTWEYLRVEPILPLETGYANGQMIDVAVTLINLSLSLSSTSS